MKGFKVACAASAVIALAVTFAVGRSPEPVVAAEPERLPVDDTLREIGTGLLKSASLIDTEPKPVLVETVVPTVLPHVNVAQVRPVETARPVSNVCTRNGMRKVMTGKYKWRCRK